MIAVTLVAAVLVYVCDCQSFPPLPPPPRKVGLPVPSLDFLTDYCNLQYPDVQLDASIRSSSDTLPRTREDRLLRDAPQSATVYRENLQIQRQFSDQASNRQRDEARATFPPLRYLTPVAVTDICTPKMKLVASVQIDNETCFTFPEAEIQYAECSSRNADIHNDFPEISQYYCVPENYRHATFLVICPASMADSTKLFRWHTVYVPTNCCAKKYICDFEPYQSANGPRLFP